MTNKDEEKERLAAEASVRIKTGQQWRDWMAVGDGLMVGRKHALRKANANEPSTPGYRKAFADWRASRPWANRDKATTAHLFWAVENHTEIERWRETLSEDLHAKINHPSVMKRRFEARTKVPRPEGQKKRQTTRDTVVELQAELDRRDADGVQVPKGSKPDDIVAVITGALTAAEVRQVVALLARLDSADAAQAEVAPPAEKPRSRKRSKAAEPVQPEDAAKEDETGLPVTPKPPGRVLN